MNVRRRVALFAGAATAGMPMLLAASSPVAAAEEAAATCRGVPATIVGSGELTGTSGRDVIVATRPDTEVRAWGGDDLICGSLLARGQAGADEIHYGGTVGRGATVYILGGAGNDVIRFHRKQEYLAAGTSDGIFGGRGADLMTAAGGALWFSGGPGNDRLVGGAGISILDGGRGDDVLLGRRSQDIITGGDGDDRLRGRAASDELSGGRGHDEVWGGRGWDVCPRGNEIEHSCEADDWV